MSECAPVVPESMTHHLERALTAGKTVLWDWNIVTGELVWFSTPEAVAAMGFRSLPDTLQAWEASLAPADRTRVLAALQAHLLASYRLGANAYVRKPVAFGEFADAVRTLGLFWLLVNERPPAVATGAGSSHEASGAGLP